jgi:hypothetical protein
LKIIIKNILYKANFKFLKGINYFILKYTPKYIAHFSTICNKCCNKIIKIILIINKFNTAIHFLNFYIFSKGSYI